MSTIATACRFYDAIAKGDAAAVLGKPKNGRAKIDFADGCRDGVERGLIRSIKRAIGPGALIRAK